MSQRLAGLLFLLIASVAHAEIKTQVIEYQVGAARMTGYLAYDDAIQGSRPGVLVVHEWWGHNAYARKRAEMLAQLGYTAFALDMYGDGKVADHPDNAMAFMQAVTNNLPEAERRFAAARAVLERQPSVDKRHIAAIGYCFGGGMVLHMARAGMGLDAVASFHGALGTQTPARAGQVKARVLVFNGADDVMSTAEQVQAFEKEMRAANVNYELVNYSGVMHGFTNPEADDFAKRFNMPLAYNAQADAASWTRMQAFLKSAFAQ
ncbi:MAG: dienelactone hydrolase family protein [Gammaproteobacteria bacterium]|nr:dienelactone hydrolase family protein [Gammaproteobacteria bacterium]